MTGFLLWGLIFGICCLAAYVVVALLRKQIPELGHGIQLLLSGSGLLGGIKLCWLVFSGELSRIIAATPPSVASGIAQEDVIYFVVGGIALAWLSIETIAKRIRALFANKESDD